MGFLSSLFGVGSRTPRTETVVQAQKLPEEISPFVKEILKEAQDLYKGEIERGYDPYTGQMIAPLTGDEQQAMAGISGLVGTTKPFIEEALGTYRTGAEKFTPETAQEYMSPYQRAVTDIEKREAQTAFERTARPAFEKRAVDAGGMSGLGTRAGVEAAEMQRGQSQLLADIEAKGLQSAFQNAQAQFAQQKARERQMAGDVGRTGPALFQAGLAEQGALQTVGQQKRELAQSALDEAYGKFLEERAFPQQTLADYSGMVYGNPLSAMPTQTTTTTGMPGAPGIGQQMLGLGLQGLNIYGAGTMGGTQGFNWGAAFNPYAKKRAGGGRLSGLSNLPVIRRQSGSIDPAIDDETVDEISVQEILTAQKPRPSLVGKTVGEIQEAVRTLDSGNLYDIDAMKEVRRLEGENLKTLLTDQAQARKELRDPFFTKEEERLKKRSEAWPTAAIARGIAVGMKEPTIAMMLQTGIASTIEDVDALGKELSEAQAQLDKQKFEVENEELSTRQEEAKQQLSRDANIQIEFLKLDAAGKKQIMEWVRLGIDLKTALAQLAKAGKPDTIKLTETIRKTAEKGAADALGLTAKYDDDGILQFIGKVDGTKMSPQDATNAQLWNQDFNKAFGTLMVELKNEPLAASRAAAYAKQQHRIRTQRPTSTQPPPTSTQPPPTSTQPPPAGGGGQTGLIFLGP